MIKDNTRKVTYGGLMIAMVFTATAIIPQIPIPFTEGYINTGDSMIFVAALLFGWKYGAIAGGVGSSLADLFLGYSHWALPTLIIKSIMGAIVGFMSKDIISPDKKVYKTTFLTLIMTIWVSLGIYLYNVLEKLITGDNIQHWIQTLELKDINSLTKLISSVQIALIVTIIAIPTLIVVLSLILRKKDKQVFSISSLIGMFSAGIWMVIGYYIGGGILKGNMIVPIFSIPANILQFIGGIVIAFPIVSGLRKTKVVDKF